MLVFILRSGIKYTTLFTIVFGGFIAGTYVLPIEVVLWWLFPLRFKVSSCSDPIYAFVVQLSIDSRDPQVYYLSLPNSNGTQLPEWSVVKYIIKYY